MVTANVQFFELLYSVYLFELAFDTVIVEYIMHSDILNYTKLPLNSLKMIQKDTVYQPIKQGMSGQLKYVAVVFACLLMDQRPSAKTT